MPSGLLSRLTRARIGEFLIANPGIFEAVDQLAATAFRQLSAVAGFRSDEAHRDRDAESNQDAATNP